MMTMKKNKFTLLELVVATGVMITLVSLLAVASKMFYDGYHRAQQITEKLEEFMGIDRIMDIYVRNMIPFKWKDKDNSSRFLFSGKENELMFTALRRAANGGNGGLLFIRLKLENDQLIAEYSPYPRLPWVEDDEQLSWKQEIISKNVASITFKYAETTISETNSSELEWLESWEENEHAAIPLAVQMNVQWKNGSEESWLRRTAGVSFHSTLGNRATVSGVSNSRNSSGVRQ